MISARDDPLFVGTRDAATLLPRGRFEALPPYGEASFPDTRREMMEQFLLGTI